MYLDFFVTYVPDRSMVLAHSRFRMYNVIFHFDRQITNDSHVLQ